MSRPNKVRVTPGFLLLLALLLWLDEDTGLLGWGALACLVHELGHYFSGRALGGRLEQLELSAVGARMRLRYPAPLTYWREMAVVLAGPSADLLMGWGAAALGQFLPAGVCFVLGGFNLLPVLPLDGGRALWCALSAWLDADWADRILTVTTGTTVGLLVGAGVFLAAGFANFTLLITSLWMLGTALREEHRGAEKKYLHF